MQENTTTKTLPRKPAQPPSVAGEVSWTPLPPVALAHRAPSSRCLLGVASSSASPAVCTPVDVMLLAPFLWGFQSARPLSRPSFPISDLYLSKGLCEFLFQMRIWDTGKFLRVSLNSGILAGLGYLINFHVPPFHLSDSSSSLPSPVISAFTVFTATSPFHKSPACNVTSGCLPSTLVSPRRTEVSPTFLAG